MLGRQFHPLSLGAGGGSSVGVGECEAQQHRRAGGNPVGLLGVGVLHTGANLYLVRIAMISVAHFVQNSKRSNVVASSTVERLPVMGFLYASHLWMMAMGEV